MMNATQTNHQTQLELARRRALANITAIQERGADVGSGWTDRSLMQQAQSKLYRIEQAQLRLTTGQYGTCQMCGEKISPERLEIVPYAEHCIPCQRQLERKHFHGAYRQVMVTN